MLVATEQTFRDMFGVIVRTGCEAIAISPKKKTLRRRLEELPRDREIHAICRSGGRAYFATRILLQKGFNARNIAGGMLSRSHAMKG